MQRILTCWGLWWGKGNDEGTRSTETLMGRGLGERKWNLEAGSGIG